jgi:HNH endonuclease
MLEAFSMSEENHTAQIEYRTISDLVGYRFTSDGRVQSCWAGSGPGSYLSDRWRDLVLVTNAAGYPVISMKRGGKYRAALVHILMAEAFIGSRPPGMEVCHRDGDPGNCRPDNLRYGTKQSNEDDKKVHGTRPRGALHGNAKLDDDKVREIRRLRRTEGTYITVLGRRFGVHHSIISDICNGKIWTHVED